MGVDIGGVGDVVTLPLEPAHQVVLPTGGHQAGSVLHAGEELAGTDPSFAPRPKPHGKRSIEGDLVCVPGVGVRIQRAAFGTMKAATTTFIGPIVVGLVRRKARLVKEV